MEKQKYPTILPNNSPNMSYMVSFMAPLVNESKQALMAQAQAEVPIKYSKIKFQPMTKAISSPTVT